jgi:zinc/manganese transport system permease protein
MRTTMASATLSLDPLADLRQLFAYHFMVNALAAGTAVALLSALVGWYMVQRRQTFAGHTLALVSFPGAAAAALAGLPLAVGYFGACALGAGALAAGDAAARSPGPRDAATGTLQAFALACGFLLVTLYHGALGGLPALLFGTFLGIDDGQRTALVVVALAVGLVLAAIGRPLLFATLDPGVARARGVPVGALSLAFSLLLGLAVAAAAQISGSLLVFCLLVTPAATAIELSPRPGRSLALALAIALAVTWLGLAIAYFSPYPVGFWITTLAFGAYLAARLWRRLRG